MADHTPPRHRGGVFATRPQAMPRPDGARTPHRPVANALRLHEAVDLAGYFSIVCSVAAGTNFAGSTRMRSPPSRQQTPASGTSQPTTVGKSGIQTAVPVGLRLPVGSHDGLLAAERFLLSLPDLLGVLLLSVDVAWCATSREVRAVIRLDGGLAGPEHQARVAFWAHLAGGKVLDPLRARADLEALVASLPHADLWLPRLDAPSLIAGVEKLARHVGLDPTQRRRVRVATELELELEGMGDGPLRTSNITENGLFVASALAPPVGDVLALRVQLPGYAQPLALRGRVTHLRQAEPGAGQPAGFGVVFENPQPAVISALARLASELEFLNGAGETPKATGMDVDPVYRLDWDDIADFRSGLATALRHGTAWVPATRPRPRGTHIVLEVDSPDGVLLRTPAEVVHAEPDGMGVVFTPDPKVDAAVRLAQDHQRRRPRKALVVDDSRLWRATLEDALRTRGVDVLLASNGEEALRLLCQDLESVQLVLCDVHMPNMDGPELLERIRNAGGESDLAVVMVSADESQQMRARLRALGADGVLSKAPGAGAVAAMAVELATRKALALDGVSAAA